MTPVTGAFENLYQILGVAAMVVGYGFAVAFGSRTQKVAGALQLMEAFGIAWLTTLATPGDPLYLMDAKSILVLIAYCVMCYRWPDRWLVLMTGLQGFAVLLHISDWLDVSLPRSVNGLLLNATGWGMLLILTTATAIHVVNRLDRRAAE